MGRHGVKQERSLQRHGDAVENEPWTGVAGLDVTATWEAEQDGQVGGQFAVNDALLRFPRDLAGLVDETINCRCELTLSACHTRIGRASTRPDITSR